MSITRKRFDGGESFSILPSIGRLSACPVEDPLSSNHHPVKPQTAIFSKGYDPQRSEGAAVPPVFRTSTFIFKTAAEGKRAFELAYGLDTMKLGESPALIYTRVNNPNCEILETKITAWDGAEDAAIFSSGMGAISSTCLAFLKPGDTLIFSDPVYGGTEFFFRRILPMFNIRTIPFPAGASKADMEKLVQNDPTVKAIFIESPANPTIMMSDIGAAREIADQYSDDARKILLIVDNTFMGPIFSSPLKLGADVILYSATKFFGGHSDLVAGLAMGSKEHVGLIKVFRTILGSNSDPDTAWLIHRSLATLQIRMEKQQENAIKIVEFLRTHPQVQAVAYPGLPEMGENQVELWKRQCTGTGSLLCFFTQGGEAEAFKVLDAIQHMKMAVSLGGVESLIEHPYSMTHADMTAAEKDHAGITQNMIRLSVGLEDPDDLIADLKQALEKS
jgi:methionine-gamma-lyase